MKKSFLLKKSTVFFNMLLPYYTPDTVLRDPTRMIRWMALAKLTMQTLWVRLDFKGGPRRIFGSLPRIF